MSYEVLFTRAAEKALGDVPEPCRARLHEAIDALAATPRPHGSKKLAGAEERFRLRVQCYRAIYTVDDAARRVVVRAVGHRREIYR